MSSNPYSAIMSLITLMIPRPILQAAFEPQQNGTTLDACIADKIIRRHILPLLGNMTGVTKSIELLDAWREPGTSGGLYEFSVLGNQTLAAVYRIPPDARDYLDITFIQKLSAPALYSNNAVSLTAGIDPMLGNTVASLSNAVLSSHTLPSTTALHQAELVGDNMIRVRGDFGTIPYFVEVMLGYDKSFTGLNKGAVMQLAELVLKFTKLYIHTNLSLEMGSAMVISGMSLGEFRETVTRYGEITMEECKEALIRFKAHNEFNQLSHMRAIFDAL